MHVSTHIPVLLSGAVGKPYYLIRCSDTFLTVWILFQASTASIPEETELERVCSHGILLAGGNGDPHIVKCTLCEKPGTSKRDSLP